MKNKLAIGFSLGIGTMLLIAATEYDLNKGVDLTGASSVTATKLNQLVDNGTVATNKGMIIYSSTTPDTTNNARYTRFIWLNSSYTPPVPYVWNSSLSLWTNITAVSSIADGSVTAGKLGANAVYATNIANAQIDNTKMIAGTVNSNILGANSVYNFHLTGSSIYSTNIVNGQLLNANYGAASITGDKIAPGSIGTSLLTNGFALQGTNIAAGTITSTNLAALSVGVSNIVVAGTSNQVLSISTDGTAVQWRTPIRTHSYTGTSANTISTDGTQWRLTFAHTLPGTPKEIRPVVVCTSVDGTFNVDDEIPLSHIVSTISSGSPFTVMANATNIYVMYYTTPLGAFGRVLSQAASPSLVTLDTSKWKIKVYATY